MSDFSLSQADDAGFDHFGYQWQLEKPQYLRTHADRPIGDWLAELWRMRGRIIYHNGYRPSFKREDGTCWDEDLSDASCFHVSARLDGRLVGCVRLTRYAGAATTWAGALLGSAQVQDVLRNLQSQWHQAAECSRWIVDPECRGNHLGRYLMFGAVAIARSYRIKTILGFAGTRERQDRALMSMGWKAVPGFDLIPAPRFKDDLRFIYCDLAQLRNRESAMADVMQSLLHLPRQETELRKFEEESTEAPGALNLINSFPR